MSSPLERMRSASGVPKSSIVVSHRVPTPYLVCGALASCSQKLLSTIRPIRIIKSLIEVFVFNLFLKFGYFLLTSDRTIVKVLVEERPYNSLHSSEGETRREISPKRRLKSDNRSALSSSDRGALKGPPKRPAAARTSFFFWFAKAIASS